MFRLTGLGAIHLFPRMVFERDKDGELVPVSWTVFEPFLGRIRQGGFVTLDGAEHLAVVMNASLSDEAFRSVSNGRVFVQLTGEKAE